MRFIFAFHNAWCHGEAFPITIERQPQPIAGPAATLYSLDHFSYTENALFAVRRDQRVTNGGDILSISIWKGLPNQIFQFTDIRFLGEVRLAAGNVLGKFCDLFAAQG